MANENEDLSLLQKALNFGKEMYNNGLDMVVPHARKEPLNPMAYVRDFNEWFAPAAQMGLDEAEGKADYPAWAYALASIPVFGKVVKPVVKATAKTGAKVAAKGGKKIDWVANRRANRERAMSDYFENMAYLNNENTFKEFNAAERNARWDNAVNYEKMLKNEAQGFIDNAEKYGMNPQHVSDLEGYIYSNDVEGINKILSMYEDAPSKANAPKAGVNVPSPRMDFGKGRTEGYKG